MFQSLPDVSSVLNKTQTTDMFRPKTQFTTVSTKQKLRVARSKEKSIGFLDDVQQSLSKSHYPDREKPGSCLFQRKTWQSRRLEQIEEPYANLRQHNKFLRKNINKHKTSVFNSMDASTRNSLFPAQLETFEEVNNEEDGTSSCNYLNAQEKE